MKSIKFITLIIAVILALSALASCDIPFLSNEIQSESESGSASSGGSSGSTTEAERFDYLNSDMAQYIAIAVTASLGSIGQAGVPGPTLMVVAVLVAAGIPIEGLPLLYALDRIFDMIRTVLNITGDAACAVVTDRFACAKTKN